MTQPTFDEEAMAIAAVTDPKPLVQSLGPQQQVQKATEMADVLATIINGKRLFSMIQGKKYVQVEGWTTLAALNGCTPCEVSNEADEDGVYVAVVELVNSEGRVIGRASAECGGSKDRTWGKRDAYARRSMANTRATSKVCRQVFSWVMVLAGYAPTPAEEMSSVVDAEVVEAPRSPPKQAQDAPERPSRGPGGVFDPKWDGQLRVRSGKHEGKRWADLETGFLEWALGKDGAIQEMAAKELARRQKEDDEPGMEWVDEPGSRG